MSSHFARAAGSEMRTFRKSAGKLCTALAEIAFLVIDFILRRYAIRVDVPSSDLNWVFAKSLRSLARKPHSALSGLALRNVRLALSGHPAGRCGPLATLDPIPSAVPCP